MKKKIRGKLGKADIIFLCFLFLLVVAIIVVSIVISVNSASSDLTKPTPTTTPTPTISSPDAGLEDDDAIDVSKEYKLPRRRRVSLNPYIRFELNIGGSGSDTLVEVINLKSNYLIGTTDSNDYDFSASDSTDIFFAVLSDEGVLERVKTFGLGGNDLPVFTKPCVKMSESEENVFLTVGLNDQLTDQVVIYRITEESLNFSSTKIKTGKNPQIKKVLSNANGISILVSTDDSSEVFEVDRNLNVKWTKKIEGFSGVDILDYGKKISILGSETKGGKMRIVDVDKGTKEVSSNTYSEKIRTPISFYPQAGGGFLVPYFTEKSGEKRAGVLMLDKNKTLQFDRELEGSGYDDVKITEVMGVENAVGYYIFASRKTGGTHFESICSHGDLMDKSDELFERDKVIGVIKNDDSILITSKRESAGQTDIVLSHFRGNLTLEREYVFGGKGNDSAVKSIINSRGELAVFATTSSVSVDVAVNFGKSDIWVIFPEIE